jgi:hypothetical protein
MYDGQDLSKQWTELLIESHGKNKIYIFIMIKIKDFLQIIHYYVNILIVLMMNLYHQSLMR